MIACGSKTDNTGKPDKPNSETNTPAPNGNNSNTNGETNNPPANNNVDQSDDSEAIYYMNMEFDEFWETFKGAIERKDFEVVNKLCKFNEESIVTGTKEFESQYDMIFDEQGLKALKETEAANIQESEAPNGKMAKAFNIIYEVEDGEGSATMMYFEKTDEGWKLTMVFMAG